jgi:DNA modification methylase
MEYIIYQGDALDTLRTLPDASVHCCVTSPPYWGLRDYGVNGQLGLESTPDQYVARMVEVFREVRRVLRDDGTLWLNLGDSYNGYMANQHGTGLETKRQSARKYIEPGAGLRFKGLKPKDLVGIPWRVAFALQSDGWWLRQDIIWHKPNPMPESVRDRCTKAHEYVFLLTKSERYFYDADAIKVDASSATIERNKHGFNGAFKGQFRGTPGEERFQDGRPIEAPEFCKDGKANRRSVWTVTTKPYSGAHFAVMPPDLVEPCIKAGCPEGGTVLDPFAGSGTTLAVANSLGRDAIGIELNASYIALAHERIATYKPKL